MVKSASLLIVCLLSLLAVEAKANEEAARSYCESTAESAATEQERTALINDCLEGLTDQADNNQLDSCYAEVQQKIEAITAADPNQSFDYDEMLAQCFASASGD